MLGIDGFDFSAEIQPGQYQTDMDSLETVQESLQVDQQGVEDSENLKEAIDGFVAIFLQQMFESMRDATMESDLLDGGFAEDVFTGMLDQEISEMGASQESFKGLNEIIYRQLSGEEAEPRPEDTIRAERMEENDLN